MNKAAYASFLGQALRTARLQAGLNQGQVATALGLTRTSVLNIEKGRQQITAHMLYQLQQMFQEHGVAFLPAQNATCNACPQPSDHHALAIVRGVLDAHPTAPLPKGAGT